MKNIIAIIISLFILGNTIQAQRKTDANIIGHVVSQGEHIPFVNIAVKGTAMGTSTDQTGHFHLIHAPIGQITLVATVLGYKTQEITVVTEAGKTLEINFDLQEDALRLDEIVVTGNKDATRRSESSIIVNSINPKLFDAAQAVTLSEGLNFGSGLRMETNCQSCGFNQIRMNGLEGSYSQILINGRPLFSGLAALYGLELIPANMIEKVEVVRGGGSALYGGNAIAGTINLKMKDPLSRTYEIGLATGLVGVGFDQPALDNHINFNTSLVSDDYKTGLSLFGFYRNRQPFDANEDDISELTLLKNTTLGARFYQRIGYKGKLTADFFHVNEYRRGGNRFDYPEHEADIAESLRHGILSGSLNYELFVRKNDLLTVYTSAQTVDRDSYYGASRSLADYGHTSDFTHHSGLQYKLGLDGNSLVFGIENTGNKLMDEKLGYRNIEQAIIVDDSIQEIPHTENTVTARQNINTAGLFLQYEQWINQVKLSLGARYDYYTIINLDDRSNDLSSGVLTPRIATLYNISEYLQFRLSFGQGYRPPQIFNEDLHTQASASRKVIHRNAAGLRQEKSNTLMASFDFNKKLGKTSANMLIEGFFTGLTDPFAYDISPTDDQGVVMYTRTNAKGASVGGLNLEINLIPSPDLSFSSGFTWQSSRYSEAREFDEKRFLRTPETYGFVTADWNPAKKLAIALTGVHTGSMLIPYYGPMIVDQETGVLRKSPSFFDLSMKVSYMIHSNGNSIEVYAGVKNLLNAFQDDFDSGFGRDPSYIYGPAQPRSITLGMRMGNMLQ